MTNEEIKWTTCQMVAMHSDKGPVMAKVFINENGCAEFTVYDKNGYRLYGEDAIDMSVAKGRCERYLRTVGWLNDGGKNLPLLCVNGENLPLPLEMK